jgi:hypothetical protein
MTLRFEIVLVFICLTAAAAQSVPAAPQKTGSSPESGFVSPDRYTNAFFGFSLPLPQDATFSDLNLSHIGSGHFLFGAQTAGSNRLTIFTISADQSKGAAKSEVQKVAAGPKDRSLKRIEIGGREFWRSVSQERSSVGKMQTITYATGLNGYILEFAITSFDSKIADELSHSVEATTFFDPARVTEIAGPSAHPYEPGAIAWKSVGVPLGERLTQLSAGAVLGNTYRNETLGFSYEFPQGWVIADKSTQEKVTEAGHQLAWGDSPAAAREHKEAEQCTRVLLWVTKYPEGTKIAKGDNPLVIVTAIDPDCLPGFTFPSSIADKEGMKTSANGIVRMFSGTPFISKGQNPVSAFTIQGHLMMTISSSSTVTMPGQKEPTSTFTSFVFTGVKGYLVTWVMMSGSEAGLQELKNTKVNFIAPAAQIR